MNMKKIGKHKNNLIYLSGILLVFISLVICFLMFRNIENKMNESATSNLHNTTKVIRDNFQVYIDSDLASLRIIGDLHKSGGHLTKEQLDVLCKTMALDWIYIIDENENIEGNDDFDIKKEPFYSEWKAGEEGYSNKFGGASGRSEIALWSPMYVNDEYIGTVFGGIVLNKYYRANIFTFYSGLGRTYLFNSHDGSFILKSLGLDGTETTQKDIYSLLASSNNNDKKVEEFKQSIGNNQSGVAVFNFNGEEAYFCFLPIASSDNWYITTVIARSDLLHESSEVKTLIALVISIICVSLLVVMIIFSIWWRKKTILGENEYREKLFTNMSENLDFVFLLYEKKDKKTAFVSSNINRLLGLKRKDIQNDLNLLFDWCHISKDDDVIVQFLNGELKENVIRKVIVANEIGENKKIIRLELIPGNLDQEIAILTDITKDDEIQESLKEAIKKAEIGNAVKNKFLSSMSHDLRTPINGIVGMSMIAAENLENPNRIRECLSKINNSSTHLLTLINEVLDVSQFESGKIEMAQESFNIAELLQNMLNMSYLAIKEKNLEANVHIGLMKHEYVIGDTLKLCRVATNVISNAIKYTPNGGTINLSLSEKTSLIDGYGCYELIVQDTGIGISEEFINKIYEPFEREEDVRISKIQGTGLGMSIVKNIVDLMMGKIEIDSKKNHGTSVKITIHLLLDKDKEMVNEQLFGLKVLVVDDDIVTAETIVNMLNDIGMKGEAVYDGDEAIEKIMNKHQNDDDYIAILLDYKMPKLDGLEISRLIHQKIQYKAPLTILMDYNFLDIEEKAKAAGIDTLLTKPVYRSKLLQKMGNLHKGIMSSTETNFKSLKVNIAGSKILLVEDNELNMEIAVELFNILNIRVDCAEDGQAAVEMFEKSPEGTYDMILMDIQMPRMNGYQATRIIRKMNRSDSKNIPIIAFTADAYKRDENRAYEAGMNDHFAKPISIEKLEEILGKYLKPKGEEQ